jgi:hypothetical protein
MLNGKKVMGTSGAFIQFSGAKRADIAEEAKAADPEGFKPTQVQALLGAKWKGMTEEGKKPFKALAAADQARYEKEMADPDMELQEPVAKQDRREGGGGGE